MYQNLRTAMSKESVTMDDMASDLSCHRNSISNKISGDTSFSVDEAVMLWKLKFPHYDFQWLFKQIPAG